MFVIFYHIDCGVSGLLVFQLLASSPLKISLVDHDPAQDDCIPGPGRGQSLFNFLWKRRICEIIFFVSRSEIE